MLSFNPESRHGGSYSNLKNNSWFENIDWDELYAKNDKKLRPVYVPERQMLPEAELVRLRDKNNGRNMQDFLRSF